jgi:hypothetical protein
MFVFAFVVCSFCSAAMVGDFSPMKVGNTWVYKGVFRTFSDSVISEKTIKIISMRQNKDSLFYTVVDSTIELKCDSCIPGVSKNIILKLNNINFFYDSSLKKYDSIAITYHNTYRGAPKSIYPAMSNDNFGFCGYHQLSDSILTDTTFLSQNLKSYSLEPYYDDLGLSSDNESFFYEWLQNYGLIHYGYFEGPYGTFTLNLISFNNQSVPIIASKNMIRALPQKSSVFFDTRNQIHWRGLSSLDRLNVQVYDCRGKLAFSSRQLQGNYILNTSQFSSKAYILRYQVNNGIWNNFSLVKN